MSDHVLESKDRTIANDLRRQARLQEQAATTKQGKSSRVER